LKIYALLDFESLRKHDWSFERFISTCSKLNVSIIQYRDKLGSNERIEENLKVLKRLSKVPIIVNDHMDLVEFCDGLHVGQDDIKKIDVDKKRAIERIREKIGSKILGISTHNKEEILEANELDVDYIGLGAYRKTSTKNDATVLSENLAKLASLSLKPVGAIGGVRISDTIENVSYLVVGSDLYEH
jgi:thiamine-phosphate pyrophosphorylase